MNKEEVPTSLKSHWSLDRWLDYLLAIHPSEIDMGLARVSRVYQRMAIAWDGCKVITIGGTNGKGSTCRFLEMTLIALGYRVGLYSSPHINNYRERVRINNESPKELAFCQTFQFVERARGQDTLTYFEFGTLAALHMLQQEPLDFVILEVGLGGRLDATNIVEPDLTVITSIGIDHQEYLGDTLESVATEKAGIFRANIPIVVGEEHAPDILVTLAQQTQSQLLIKGNQFGHTIHDAHSWSWCCGGVELTDLPLPKLPLTNVSTAMATLHLLDCLKPLIEQSRLTKLISEIALPGRLQVIKTEPLWITDVAHNPQAAELLAQHVREKIQGNVFIILGMMKDKSIEETLIWFESFDALWFPVSLSTERAATAAELGQHLSAQKVVGEFDSVKAAVDAINHRVTANDTVLVFGSFVTVADVLTLREQGQV